MTLSLCHSVLLLLAVFGLAAAATTIPATSVRTFSGAIKGQPMCPCQTCVHGLGCTNCSSAFAPVTPGCLTATNFESLLYTYTAASSKTPSASHVIRLLWITGDLLWMGFRNVTLRVYIDGEADAAVAFRLYESHALGFGWDQGEQRTWGTPQVGKGALFGGLYLTIPVPFASSFRVTAEMEASDRELGFAHGVYFIVRGLLHAPVVLAGQLELPATARLRVHRTSGTYDGAAEVPLATVPSSSGGLVYFVTMLASSGNPHFLEGEFFAAVDGEQPPLRLSSGTEDYFLSAQYFDAGEFQLPNAGCNHVSLACLDGLGACRVAAYRLHDRDPVVFQQGLVMTWVVGDGHWTVLPTAVDFTTWVYEWPAVNASSAHL